MKKLILALIFLASFTGFAEAQSQRNPCFYLSGSTTYCVPVSVDNPLPVTGGGGGGGLSVTDQSAFTQGTSPLTPGGGVYNDAATLTSGQQGMYRLTTKRAQVIDVDTTGSSLYSALTSPIADCGASPCTNRIGVVWANQSGTWSIADITTGNQKTQIVDGLGNVIGSNSNSLFIGGNVASGATDSGNPVKVGGRYNSTQPTLTDGQRSDHQLDTRGNLKVTLMGKDTQNAATQSWNGDTVSEATSGLTTSSMTYVHNGTVADRMFTCASSAVVNVTAGSTTQLIALSGSTNIRVCSIALTISAAGTAQFVSGTGANCGTGTANLTGAMTLATGTPLTISASNASLFRAGASNALCLAAVTGNVTGFISYTQF